MHRLKLLTTDVFLTLHLQHSTLNISHSTFHTQHSTFNTQHFIYPVDDFAQQPRQRQGDDDTDEEGEPVAPRLREIIEHEMEMNEIALQAQ